MRSFRMLVITLVTAGLCVLAAPSRASLGTNFSDQWWNPNESGWGASVLQQYDTLFVDLFVYAPDGRPTWYTAAARFQPQSGRTLFAGDLYVTSGPWFGAFFNPAAVRSALRWNAAVRREQHGFRDPHLFGRRHRRDEGRGAPVVDIRGFQRQLLWRARLRPERMCRSERQWACRGARTVSDQSPRRTTPSRSRCSRISATVRSPATTASSDTWERWMRTIRARTG